MKTQPYIDAFKSLPGDIRQAEVHLEGQARKSVSMRDGALDDTLSYQRFALYVRATGRNTGIVYTENLGEDPVEVMRRAIAGAAIVSAAQEVPLTPPIVLQGGAVPLAQPAPTFEELTAAAAALEKKAQALCGDARLEGFTLAHTRYADEVANSLGLAVESGCDYYSLDMHVVCQSGGVMGEKAVTLLAGHPASFPLERALADVLTTARLQTAPSAVPSGRHDLILSRYAGHQFMFMLWRSMSAMQKRQSGCAFAGKEGLKIGDSSVSIISSGSHPACPICYAFDNEGMPVTHTRLMDKGVFKSMLHNRSTAQEAGVPSTGNAGRRITISGAIQVPLLVTPKILYVEEGGLERDEMLAQMGDGLVVDTILDEYHGIDYSSGEFSVPVMCLVVRDGRVCGASRALVWSGNLKDVLNKTQAAGKEVHFSCFRDSFTLGTPDMLVRNQAIASAG